MFERKPLRTDVGAEILGRIIDGRLPSGTRINESRLSQELGISRTPLREAMLCLSTDGVLSADMGRGFQVPHLAGREISDLAQTLAVDLAAAVRLGVTGDMKSQLELTNTLGRARMQADRAAALCEQIYLLLRDLCRDCPNGVLRSQCQRLIRRILRYVHEAHARGWSPAPLLDHLEGCLDQLHQDDRLGAADSFGRAMRELGAELAARFPAEVVEQA
jgi:DNA-binding GntR family transcriptional regulator